MTRPADPRHAGPATAGGRGQQHPGQQPPGRPHPAAGLRRLVRVVVLGGSSLVLAGAAHLLAGGSLPPVGVLAVLTLLVGLVAVTTTARRCRTPLLVAVLGVEQLALHTALAATAVPAGVTACLAGAHARHGAGAGCPGPVPPTVPGSAGAPTAEALMWTAHAAAVLATAWLLARGETLLWRAVDRVSGAVPVPCPRRRPPRARLRTPAPPATASRRPRTAAAPRGPPLLVRPTPT